MAYNDLREYLAVLEKRGKLHRITIEVDKTWEIAAVCRRVYQKIPPAQRPAVLFERVKGSGVPLVAGALGGSREIYALALETTVAGIMDKWRRAQPVEPILVDSGPCQENVLLGDHVDLGMFPVPVWTAEHDPGPYITAPFVVSRDPQTGQFNVGTYRMQVKGRNRTGIMANPYQDVSRHIAKYEAMDRPAPLAVVIGADPVLGLTSVSKIKHGPSEYTVAGGLRGEPVPLVNCRTVPLAVPATAEIVLEGEVAPGVREWEGPFGEYTGYMGPAGNYYVFEVKCVTFRNQPIFQAFVSQMPPSESSCIRGLGREMLVYRHLKENLGLPVHGVHFRESGGSGAYLIIAMEPEYEGQVQEAIWGAWSVGGANFGKITVVVNSDIDIFDPFQVEWAISFRVRPEKDVQIVHNAPALGLDPAMGPPSVSQHDKSRRLGGRLAIDATRKYEYPPLSLPPEKHLQAVDSHWDIYGFSKLEATT